MLDSTASLRELLHSYQQLLGVDGPAPSAPERDGDQEARRLVEEFLNQLLGMDIELS